jgi:hypothetical protein
MDFITEDGLHTSHAGVSSLEGSLEYLSPHGFYVVEDIFTRPAAMQDYDRQVSSSRFSQHEFVLAELRNTATKRTPNLSIIRRSKSQRTTLTSVGHLSCFRAR